MTLTQIFKKSILTTLFALSLVFTGWAADPPPLKYYDLYLGVTAPSSCTTENDGELSAMYGDSDTNVSACGNVDCRKASEFTLAATSTITQFVIRAYKDGATNVFTLRCEIRVDNAVGEKPQEGNVEGVDYITGGRFDFVIASGDWGTSVADRALTLVTPLTGVPAGNYWLSCGPSSVTSGYPILQYDSSQDGKRLCISADASTTHSYPSCQANQTFRYKVMGCAE